MHLCEHNRNYESWDIKKKKGEENYNHRLNLSSGNDATHRKSHSKKFGEKQALQN